MMRFFATAAVLVAGVFAEESADSKVVVLTKDNFQPTLESGPTFIKFYAPWCGHCKRLTPVWDQLAEKSDITIAKLDATVEQEVAEQWKVRGYPSLVLVDGKSMYDYNGGRDFDSLLEFSNGGYKSASGKNLPWDQTFADKALEYLKEYAQKIQQVHAFEPTLLPVVFMTGLILAASVMVIVFALFGGKKRKVAAPAAKTETKKEQ